MNRKFLKSTIAALGLALALVITPSQIAQAAEFTVTDVSAVLWTNDSTALCSDADITTTVVPVVEAGLPVQVTGITSNGYFKIIVGTDTFYVAGIGLSADTSTTTTDTTATATTSSTGWTQESVSAALMNLKATKYPEGLSYDMNTKVTIKNGIGANGTCTGTGSCGFVYGIWKDIFGEDVIIASVLDTYDPSDIKVGDITYTDDGAYAIVTDVTENGFGYVTLGEYTSDPGNVFIYWTTTTWDKTRDAGYDDYEKEYFDYGWKYYPAPY